MYVIRRKKDGLYVTKPGSKSSYTTQLENARPYNTKEEAVEDLCVESEYVMDVKDIFNFF